MAAKKRKKKAAAKAQRKTAKRKTAKRGKRKPTAKQLRAWRKNIKKAQAALGYGKKKRKAVTKKSKKPTAKRKTKKRLTPAQKAARTRAKYARQREAYTPLLSPGVAAQQLAHRAQAKKEDRAMRRMYADLKKGKHRKARPLTLQQKADLALASLDARQLKGLAKAGATQLQLKLTGTENPRRRRRRKGTRNSAYPYVNSRRKHKARKRNPGAQWWIADLYQGGSKQTFIDIATRVEAEYSARQLAARNAGARVELSGPYTTQPTASTARR